MVVTTLLKYANYSQFHSRETSYSACFLCSYVLLLASDKITIKSLYRLSSIGLNRHPANSDFNEHTWKHLSTPHLLAYSFSDSCDTNMWRKAVTKFHTSQFFVYRATLCNHQQPLAFDFNLKMLTFSRTGINIIELLCL